MPQPVAIGYDDFGQRVRLSTFRDDSVNWAATEWPSSMDPDDPADADITQWMYDESTGLLIQKTYADGSHVDYDYTIDGKLAVRTWARQIGNPAQPLTTTYGYSTGAAGTSELLTLVYSDSITPNVTFTYTRLGQVKTVTDGIGNRALTYTQTGSLQKEKYESGSLLSPKVVTLTQTYYVAYGEAPLIAMIPFTRLAAIDVGTNANQTANYHAYYNYDGDTDRMSAAFGLGLPTGSGVEYEYLPDSNLVWKLKFMSGSTVKASVTCLRG